LNFGDFVGLSRRELGFIFLLLVILNILFRYPLSPHELGNDSYYIHELAQSIVDNSSSEWLLSPLSFFGLYPFSYSSGLPHFLAVTSLLTNLPMESTIFFDSLFFAIFGIFTFYILAGELKKDQVFQLTAAFIFSVSPLAIKFTSWTVSSRGLILMFIPLVIWCLLKIKNVRDIKYISLFIVFFIILASIHKTFVLFILIILAFLFTKYIVYSDNRYLSKIFKHHYYPYILCGIFISVFILQFFLIPGNWLNEYKIFFNFNLNIWYESVLFLIVILTARLGLLIPLSILGVIYLIFDSKKSVNESFLIYAFLFFLPFLYYSIYFYETLLPFWAMLSVYGIFFLTSKVQQNRSLLCMIILIAIIVFSAYTVQIRYTSTDEGGYKNYLQEPDYALTGFIQHETNNQNIGGGYPRQIAPFISNPLVLMPTDQLIYHNIDKNLLKIELSPFPTSLSELFHFVKHTFDYSYSGDTKKYPYKYIIMPKNSQKPNSTDNKIYANDKVDFYDI